MALQSRVPGSRMVLHAGKVINGKRDMVREVFARL